MSEAPIESPVSYAMGWPVRGLKLEDLMILRGTRDGSIAP